MRITKHNREKILKKANALVNQSETKARVLQRCRISYRQLLALSRDPNWERTLFFSKPQKASIVWRPHSYVDLLREFVYRQSQCNDLTIPMMAWMFGRNERTIRRWISDKKHTETH